MNIDVKPTIITVARPILDNRYLF